MLNKFSVLHSPLILYSLHAGFYYNKHAFTSRGGNSVDLDQLASEKPADLDLYCFPIRIYSG